MAGTTEAAAFSSLVLRPTFSPNLLGAGALFESRKVMFVRRAGLPLLVLVLGARCSQLTAVARLLADRCVQSGQSSLLNSISRVTRRNDKGPADPIQRGGTSVQKISQWRRAGLCRRRVSHGRDSITPLVKGPCWMHHSLFVVYFALCFFAEAMVADALFFRGWAARVSSAAFSRGQWTRDPPRRPLVRVRSNEPLSSDEEAATASITTGAVVSPRSPKGEAATAPLTPTRATSEREGGEATADATPARRARRSRQPGFKAAAKPSAPPLDRSNLLIVGLGNPGEAYRTTRHNMGFLVAEEFARRCDARLRASTPFQGEYAAAKVAGKSVGILRPTTFMNLSGRAAKKAMDYYKLPAGNVLVLVDEVALDFGALRLRTKGSAGGHNGLKSMQQSLGTQEYPRLRIGIGAAPGAQALSDWVLGEFSRAERRELDDIVARAADAVLHWIEEDDVEKVVCHANSVGAAFTGGG